MSDQEIADRVEGWNWNLSIFEIYDEVKDMQRHHNQWEDLSRLLNYAYEYFKYDPMIRELMSFLNVEITDYEEKHLGESTLKEDK